MRYAIVRISPIFLLELFKIDNIIKISSTIPRDAKFIRVVVNNEWDYINLVIESSQLDVLREGDEIPVIEDILFKLK